MTDQYARLLVQRLLARVRGGVIVLEEDGVVTPFGTPGSDGLLARVVVRDRAFYRHILRGSIGLGLAYADGLWDVDDLVTLFRIGARNMERFDAVRRRLRPVTAPTQLVLGAARRNTIGRARHQIAAHYDVGNDMYASFLDDTMTYSAAIFPAPGASLEEAQTAKLERICRKLDLGPSDRLLEIGGGWGGFALHAARRHGTHVTTVTLSAEQHGYMVNKIREAGLQERVDVRLQDYRTLTGTYDKLVSIEMIEAVGWQDFPTFFAACDALLEADGAMVLQAITIDDRAYDVEKATRTFIKSIMFPGGCLPSVEALSRTAARSSSMRIVQLEDITAHYVTTIQRWRARFTAATERLEQQGYDEPFRRRWALYLAYCEAGFVERRIQDVQLVLAKPGFRAEPLWPLPDSAPAPAPAPALEEARAS